MQQAHALQSQADEGAQHSTIMDADRLMHGVPRNTAAERAALQRAKAANAVRQQALLDAAANKV